LGWLFAHSDRYLLALLDTPASVGRYAAAYGIAATPIAVLGTVVPTVAYARLVRASDGGHPRGQRVWRQSMLLQGAMVGAGVLVVGVLAPVGVSLLLGPSYRQGAEVIIRLVAVGQGLQVMAYVLDVESYAIMSTGAIARAYSAAFVVNLGVNLILIPRLGPEGAAWATALAGAVYFVVLLVLNGRRGETASLGS